MTLNYQMVCIQRQIFYQVHHKKHETLLTNPPIHIYINRINSRLQLQTFESLKLIGTTKKLIDTTKRIKS